MPQSKTKSNIKIVCLSLLASFVMFYTIDYCYYRWMIVGGDDFNKLAHNNLPRSSLIVSVSCYSISGEDLDQETSVQPPEQYVSNLSCINITLLS